MKAGEAEATGATGDHTNTYWEDTRMMDLKQAFLGRGFIPPGLDEEDLAIAVLVATAADKHNGTYRILSR
jgi:hypothetical protein